MRWIPASRAAVANVRATVSSVRSKSGPVPIAWIR